MTFSMLLRMMARRRGKISGGRVSMLIQVLQGATATPLSRSLATKLNTYRSQRSKRTTKATSTAKWTTSSASPTSTPRTCTKPPTNSSTPNSPWPPSHLASSTSARLSVPSQISPNVKCLRPSKSQWTSNKKRRSSNRDKCRTSKMSGRKPSR